MNTTLKRVRYALKIDIWARVSLIWIIFMLAVAVFSDLILKVFGVDPYTYNTSILDYFGVPVGAFGGISSEHVLGVEPQTGRDLFAIIISGARVSLFIGISATVISVLIALLLGISAGYAGGVYDKVVSRLIDIMLGFPSLVFMIAVGAIVPDWFPRTILITVIIGLFGWASMARVIRAETISLKNRLFVKASKAMGAGTIHILCKQILPNLWSTIIVLTTMSIPGKIGSEAALSFLGVGIRPPTHSWGRTIGTALAWVQADIWYVFFPSLALFLITLAFNQFGDMLSEALDPNIVLKPKKSFLSRFKNADNRADKKYTKSEKILAESKVE